MSKHGDDPVAREDHRQIYETPFKRTLDFEDLRMTTYHYERSYGTARAVFAVEEFVGWTVAFIGVLFTLSAFFGDGLQTPFLSAVSFKLHAESAVFEMVLVVAGVFAVANAQTNRAIVDNAELTRDLLAVARRSAPPTMDGGPRARREPSISLPTRPGAHGSAEDE